MSKQSDNNNLKSVQSVRVSSILQVKEDFKTGGTVPKSGYDLRIYRDPSDGKLYYPYTFSKTLSHNSLTGMPLKDDVDLLIKAIDTGSQSDINAVPRDIAATRKLENLSAGNNFNLGGIDSSSVLSDAKQFTVDTEGGVFQMAEVYSLSLLRDVSYIDIENSSNAIANGHIGYLNAFTDKTTAPLDGMGNITAKLLHRGIEPGCEVGPYVSQYLYLPFNYGNIPITQQYNREPDQEGTTVLADFLRIQNGENHLVSGASTPNQYVNNPRVLGSIVHNDPLYQFYYNAALISFQNGIGSEFGGSNTNSSWISAGGPSILESLASVSVEALQAAWFHKFQVGLRIRPEVFAQRLDDVFNESPGSPLLTDCPGYSTLRGYTDGKLNMLLAEVRAANASNSNLLRLQYPEGSPCHPSTPAGHSLVAGACCTVLKAMLDTVDTSNAVPVSKPWLSGVIHSVDGTSTTAYPNSSAGMTINGELNKLMSNISIARDISGVHYRTDGQHLLAEKVAISHLINKCRTFHESYNGRFQGFTLQKLDGSFVRLTKDGEQSL